MVKSSVELLRDLANNHFAAAAQFREVVKQLNEEAATYTERAKAEQALGEERNEMCKILRAELDRNNHV